MKELEMNPYVIQIDKFVNSLEKLSRAFLHLEDKQEGITDETYQIMREDVRERVCKQCDHHRSCNDMKLLRELVHTIEHYGAELNVEVKRKIQKQCAHEPQFLRAVSDVYKNEKQNELLEQ